MRCDEQHKKKPTLHLNSGPKRMLCFPSACLCIYRYYSHSVRAADLSAELSVVALLQQAGRNDVGSKFSSLLQITQLQRN